MSETLSIFPEMKGTVGSVWRWSILEALLLVSDDLQRPWRAGICICCCWWRWWFWWE